MAADDRIYHLFTIMKKKECSCVNKIESQITNTAISTNNIPEQLKELKELYKSGDITKEEYRNSLIFPCDVPYISSLSAVCWLTAYK